MPITLDGTGSISGLSATGISAVQNLPNPAVITTLNAPSGVLATQNGMTGIAKAWVLFNASAGILGSFNVSSVTLNSNGNYTINFTTAMANANYATVGSCGNADTNKTITNTNYSTAPTTSAVSVATYNTSGTVIAYAYNSFVIFGA